MWRLLAPVLALAVLAAHFFRAGSITLVMACLALAALVFRHPRLAAFYSTPRRSTDAETRT
jgi:hypothetical protein